jgi:hypothetical protein
LADELVEVVVGFVDLCAQLLVAACESAQGRLGRLLGVEVGSGAQLRAGCDQRRRAQVPQLFAELLGTGDEQGFDLVMAWVRALTALERATRRARIAST